MLAASPMPRQCAGALAAQDRTCSARLGQSAAKQGGGHGPQIRSNGRLRVLCGQDEITFDRLRPMNHRTWVSLRPP
jgi:hypothetical protein